MSSMVKLTDASSTSELRILVNHLNLIGHVYLTGHLNAKKYKECKCVCGNVSHGTFRDGAQ
jgi:hypothetical protein